MRSSTHHTRHSPHPHTAQQAVLGWMVKSPSPIRQEVVNQLIGPIQYPLLRRSLRRLRSTGDLDGFLRPVLVPDNHARGALVQDMAVGRIPWCGSPTDTPDPCAFTPPPPHNVNNRVQQLAQQRAIPGVGPPGVPAARRGGAAGAAAAKGVLSRYVYAGPVFLILTDL